MTAENQRSEPQRSEGRRAEDSKGMSNAKAQMPHEIPSANDQKDGTQDVLNRGSPRAYPQ